MIEFAGKNKPSLLLQFGMAPVMAYLYLRHASIFGKKQPACLLPQDDKPLDKP